MESDFVSNFVNFNLKLSSFWKGIEEGGVIRF